MITPQELRIGNYLALGEDVLLVNEIHKTGFYAGNEVKGTLKGNVWQIEPIELTEEWLMKFGLETDNEVDEIDGVMFKLYHLEDYIIEYWIRDNTFKFTDDCALEVFVSSVHQLQNLYFALVGEELTKKE